MMNRLAKIISIVLLSFLISGPAYSVTLQEAARQAARANNAKVLSARIIQRGNIRQYEIKLLTQKGVVKTVRRPAPPVKKPKPKNGQGK